MTIATLFLLISMHVVAPLQSAASAGPAQRQQSAPDAQKTAAEEAASARKAAIAVVVQI